MDARIRLINALIRSEGEFADELLKVINEKNLDLSDFAKKSGIAYPTLYKIVHRQRAPSMRTLRRILKTFYPEERNFIAVIATRHILEDITPFRSEFMVKEYTASNFEEAIIMAVKAEKEGAIAIVCAPILSTTIEKIVDIPVFTMKPKGSIVRAVKQAIKKISSYYSSD